jgi:glyoxylase-like metal-dependent hydrolase (beta-lactamase superfamily II)
MKIIPLSEGSFTIDQTKEFVPFDKEKDDLQQRTRGSLLVEIQPFLIILENDVLLLDTGLGFTDERDQLQLHNNLLEHGVNPLDVTKVLMTHLHKDHAGGIGKKDKFSGEWHMSFPNATYYVNEKEWNEAVKPGNPSYFPEPLMALANASQLELIGDEGMINENIRYQLSGAHSIFHQVFWISENQETAFFGGDEAPQWQQMKSKFVAKYDFDGRKSMELRQTWMDEGKNQGWTFLFYHDIGTPVVKV